VESGDQEYFELGFWPCTLDQYPFKYILYERIHWLIINSNPMMVWQHLHVPYFQPNSHLPIPQFYQNSYTDAMSQVLAKAMGRLQVDKK
jgi:hypothetical protein